MKIINRNRNVWPACQKYKYSANKSSWHLCLQNKLNTNVKFAVLSGAVFHFTTNWWHLLLLCKRIIVIPECLSDHWQKRHSYSPIEFCAPFLGLFPSKKSSRCAACSQLWLNRMYYNMSVVRYLVWFRRQRANSFISLIAYLSNIIV